MIIDNQQRQRLELSEEGKLAFADYTIADGVMSIHHVEADLALRGKGTAGRLMKGVVAYAEERSLKIAPICGYAVLWLIRGMRGR
ncbi:MAG: GNAT family N-acetyltransferase [Akkermansiaceae bacterium]